jgi:hypothetical protein
MEKTPKPYVEMVKDGPYQVKVPIAGHAMPHVFPHEFHSKESAENWIETPSGLDLIKQVEEKYTLRRS